ncbi:hypothetical protein PR048_004908 [Dryococelus australis]|uniref:Uncharacterized protein n=1 Tax=Dryococelus australis TaxID=614101 RepID=A0ABQ9I8T4_9NEOP|nr:hypothetical protein PR048_004908 [Dryococelus australis]
MESDAIACVPPVQPAADGVKPSTQTGLHPLQYSSIEPTLWTWLYGPLRPCEQDGGHDGCHPVLTRSSLHTTLFYSLVPHTHLCRSSMTSIRAEMSQCDKPVLSDTDHSAPFELTHMLIWSPLTSTRHTGTSPRLVNLPLLLQSCLLGERGSIPGGVPAFRMGKRGGRCHCRCVFSRFFIPPLLNLHLVSPSPAGGDQHLAEQIPSTQLSTSIYPLPMQILVLRGMHGAGHFECVEIYHPEFSHDVMPRHPCLGLESGHITATAAIQSLVACLQFINGGRSPSAKIWDRAEGHGCGRLRTACIRCMRSSRREELLTKAVKFLENILVQAGHSAQAGRGVNARMLNAAITHSSSNIKRSDIVVTRLDIIYIYKRRNYKRVVDMGLVSSWRHGQRNLDQVIDNSTALSAPSEEVDDIPENVDGDTAIGGPSEEDKGAVGGCKVKPFVSCTAESKLPATAPNLTAERRYKLRLAGWRACLLVTPTPYDEHPAIRPVPENKAVCFCESNILQQITRPWRLLRVRSDFLGINETVYQVISKDETYARGSLQPLTAGTRNYKRTEIKAKIQAGNRFYYRLSLLFKSHILSRILKFQLYNTLIPPVMLYGCETWIVRKQDMNNLFIFERKVLRKIFTPVRDANDGEWWIRHHHELVEIYNSLNVVGIMRSTSVVLESTKFGSWRKKTAGWTKEEVRDRIRTWLKCDNLTKTGAVRDISGEDRRQHLPSPWPEAPACHTGPHTQLLPHFSQVATSETLISLAVRPFRVSSVLTKKRLYMPGCTEEDYQKLHSTVHCDILLQICIWGGGGGSDDSPGSCQPPCLPGIIGVGR